MFHLCSGYLNYYSVGDPGAKIPQFSCLPCGMLCCKCAAIAAIAVNPVTALPAVKAAIAVIA